MAERIMCANEDHPRPVLAVARLSWPKGPYRPTTACVGCREWSFHQAAEEAHAILIEPIPEAYGPCPCCRGPVRLRMDGKLTAHKIYGTYCNGGGRDPKVATDE